MSGTSPEPLRRRHPASQSPAAGPCAAALTSPAFPAAVRTVSNTIRPPSLSASRARNSLSTEKSKPVSVNSRDRAYFQSSRVRTACAACRRSPLRELQHRHQRQPGRRHHRPPPASPRPFGNTARATRTVSSGISANSTLRNDTNPPQEHDDGLHNPNGVAQAVDTHAPGFTDSVRFAGRGLRSLQRFPQYGGSAHDRAERLVRSSTPRGEPTPWLSLEPTVWTRGYGARRPLPESEHRGRPGLCASRVPLVPFRQALRVR